MSDLWAAVAAAHLAAARLLPGGAGGRFAGPFAASAAGAFFFFLFRFVQGCRNGRLAELAALIAWGLAAVFEGASLWPALEQTNLVSTVSLFAAGFVLSPARAVTYAVFGAGWLLYPRLTAGGFGVGEAALALLSAAAVAAGWGLRRKMTDPRRDEAGIARAVEESRSFLLPWEKIDAALDRDPLEAVEKHGLLAWRADLEEGIRRVVEGVAPVVAADGVFYVFAEGAKGGRLRVIAPAGPAGASPSVPVAVSEDFAPVREALVFNKTFFADGLAAASWARGLEGPTEVVGGLAVAPVVSEGKVEGALLAFRCAPGRWSEPVIPALEMGAYFIAREIGRTRAFYATARYLAQRAGLDQTIREIARIAERGDADGEGPSVRQAVYRTIAGRVRQALGTSRSLIVEADPQGGKGRIAWETGPGRQGAGGDWTALRGTYLEWTILHGAHRVFSDTAANPPKYPVLPAVWTEPGEEAFFVLPIAGVAEFCGALVCTAGKGRRFDRGDVEAARDLVAVMRMGLTHALREEWLRKEAARDGLTGLYNKKTFCANLEKALGRLDGRHPCAVVMLDIDHFKRINDTYGHAAGDEVLRRVAAVIRKAIRKGDMAGRYGGEEFAIYLNLVDPGQALQGAERLRLMIQQARFEAGEKKLPVTASLGVACYPLHGRKAADLLEKADAALYRSKAAGRDRTTVF